MIKINLLPVRATKKKETIRQQVVLMVVSLSAVIAICVLVFLFLQVKIQYAKGEIENSENEIKELKAKIGKVNDLKKLKDEVTKKLDVLSMLRKGKVGPVHRLMTISDATPEKLWLTKYSESGNDVSISGISYNEDLIAEFMKNLEASQDYENIELLVSEQTNVAGVKAKRFDLRLKIKSAKISEAKPQVQKK
ncbi:MAG TPA: PilN domain-containing protein [Geobacteraceae bacterium]|nr:PilN domain-containing protein [Geobacteraceae bacterium]